MTRSEHRRKARDPMRRDADTTVRELRASASRRLAACLSLLALFGLVACDSGGSGVAATGGTSGTGISQGSVIAFGSIFVNGVEWDLSGATIEIDGRPASEAELRLGMVVRIEGVRDASGTSGTATSVVFDDAIEGPITATPIETIPGVEKSFDVLGSTIFVDSGMTIFAGGTSFVGLAADDVVEVSGFVDENGAIRATRIEAKGDVSTNDEVELRGIVANLTTNPDATGIFDLGSIVVRYDAATSFSGVSRATLANGDLVEIAGRLRVSGTDVDAEQLELEDEGLGSDDVDRVELEGIVASCPQSPDFCVSGVPVDASSATFEPVGFVPMPGDAVEVEGSLVAGTLVADEVASEAEGDEGEIKIDAAVTSVDAAARTLVILGVTVMADGETEIEDSSVVEDQSFTFGEILPGDYLEVRAFESGPGEIRAKSIKRDDATPGADDVRLEGPVTALDPNTPTMSILDQPIPLDMSTQYFDQTDTPRSEEEFFRTPGDVMLGDIVRATDASAVDLGVLDEADEVELEN